MHVKTSLAALVAVGLGSVSFAHAETLEDALVAAYTANPALMAQRAQLRATDELVPQALANWRPTVRLSGDAGENSAATNANDYLGKNAPPEEQSLFARDGSLTVAQPLYRGGQTEAQTAQAEAQVKAGQQQLAATEQSIFMGVVSAYLDVIQNQALVDLNVNNEQVLQRELDATNDRFRVGEVTRTDTSQAQAALAGAHAGVRQAQATLRDSIATFTHLVGHRPSGLEAVTPPASLPETLEATDSAAANSNPQVLAQQYAYEAAQHGIDLEFGALLPQVTLQGNYSRTEGASGPGIYTRSAEALVNVTVPLYQQGAEYSRVRQQKHTAGQQRLQLDETRRAVVETASQNWENWQSARARVVSFEEQVRAATVALQGIQREYLVGARTILDVLQTEQNLLSARVSLEEARHDATVEAFQIKSSIGQLTAQALQLRVPIYDPTKHYNEVRDEWIGTGVEPNYQGGGTK
jgi:outer membrane protein